LPESLSGTYRLLRKDVDADRVNPKSGLHEGGLNELPKNRLLVDQSRDRVGVLTVSATTRAEAGRYHFEVLGGSTVRLGEFNHESGFVTNECSCAFGGVLTLP